MGRALRSVESLDRRWIFLLLGIAVTLPILFPRIWPERPTALVRSAFGFIEGLPPGSRVLLSFDYDPGHAPELDPMAAALTWHCARRGHKLYFLSLWPVGPDMIRQTVNKVLRDDFRDAYVYGRDYVILGYKPGLEAVIKVLVSDLPQLYTTDHAGTPLAELPLTSDLADIQAMDLIISLSGGEPGTREWVQYAANPYGIPIVSGATGVQAPRLYPYVPDPLLGLLGAIKGAAEYEAALAAQYAGLDVDERGATRTSYARARERMGPQFVAHVLILGLILAGNMVLLLNRFGRTRGGRDTEGDAE